MLLGELRSLKCTGNGGLTHVTASDTGAMSLEAGMASIEIGDFGSGTIS